MKHIVIKIPQIKRWILRIVIGSAVKDLQKHHKFYTEHLKKYGDDKDSKGYVMYNAHQKGIKESIDILKKHYL